MLRLFAIFTIVPTVELWLLFQIGGKIGFFETIWLVIITGIIGASMAKREGLSVLREIQEATQTGAAIPEKLGEGILVLIGGILLVTPGILTDFFGFSLIFPWTRKSLLPILRNAIAMNTANMQNPFPQASSNNAPFSEEAATPTEHNQEEVEEYISHDHNKGFRHPTF